MTGRRILLLLELKGIDLIYTLTGNTGFFSFFYKPLQLGVGFYLSFIERAESNIPGLGGLGEGDWALQGPGLSVHLLLWQTQDQGAGEDCR